MTIKFDAMVEQTWTNLNEKPPRRLELGTKLCEIEVNITPKGKLELISVRPKEQDAPTKIRNKTP